MQKFKIYPFRKSKNVWDRSSWWAIVLLGNPVDLRKETNKKCPICKTRFIESKDHVGLTHSHGYKYRVDNFGNPSKPEVKGELGIIFLQELDAGAGVVAHEICHATLYTVMRYTAVLNFQDGMFSKADEWIAQINGNLNAYYWGAINKF